VRLRVFLTLYAWRVPRETVRLDVGLFLGVLLALLGLLAFAAHFALVHVDLLLGSDSDAY
jgi:hypothetical protein